MRATAETMDVAPEFMPPCPMNVYGVEGAAAGRRDKGTGGGTAGGKEGTGQGEKMKPRDRREEQVIGRRKRK